MPARKAKSASKPKGKGRSSKAAAELRRNGRTLTVKDRRNKGRTGRPTLYHPSMAQVAKAMAENGAFKSEIAAALGISYQTLRNWQATKQDFFDALNVNEIIATEHVERSLLQRATGYEYAAEKVFQYRGEIIRAPVIEHCPPDPQAAMKWLTNRAPDRWQERTVRDVNATVTVAHTFEEYLALVHGKSAPALEVVAEVVKDET